MQTNQAEILKNAVHGAPSLRRCRCVPCSLSVYVAATPAPVACPYCQRSLAVEEARRPLAPEAPVPSAAELKHASATHAPSSSAT